MAEQKKKSPFDTYTDTLLMATINFYLWEPDTSGRAKIYLVYQERGEKFRHYTGEKILPKHWDTNQQRGKRNYPDSPDLNQYLQALEDRLKSLVRKARGEGKVLSVPEVRDLFKPAPIPKVNLQSFITDFLEFKKTYTKLDSMKIYQTMFNHMKEYFTFSKRPFESESFDLRWYEGFIDFLQTQKKQTDNTVHKQVKTLVTFINWANKRGAGINPDMGEKRVSKREAAKVYLTMEELRILMRMDCGNIRLENARDVFIFACLTGLRYSDLAQLSPEHIYTSISVDGKQVREIRLMMVKTESPVNIPLNSQAEEILNRYEGQYRNCLPVISNQKFNDYLKELCYLAGITQNIKRVRFRGKERIEETLPKAEMVTVHTARHTFATLSLELGMRPEVVMKLLGHTSIKMTMSYVRIMDEVKAKEMMTAWNITI